MENEIKSYKDLIVWQKSIKLVTLMYSFTNEFPKEEVYGLTSQLRRAVISIPSNIAEGKGRGSAKNYRSFLIIAQGSCYEVETQLEISRQLNFGEEGKRQEIEALLIEVMKMLSTLITKLKP